MEVERNRKRGSGQEGREKKERLTETEKDRHRLIGQRDRQTHREADSE